MTEKKQYELRLCNNGLYYLWKDGDLFIGDDGYITFVPFDKNIGQWFVDELNKLFNENEQLKKKNELLSDELSQHDLVIDRKWDKLRL